MTDIRTAEPIAAPIRIEHALHATDWTRLADVMARAPLRVRAPAALARAFAASYASAFAFAGDTLVGCARALSDGEFYATLHDVAVDPDWQGVGIGRRLVLDLLDRLPVEKVYLTAVPGRQGFYARLGFLPQTTAMGWYAAAARGEAIARGTLLAPAADPAGAAGAADAGLASPGALALSN